MSLREAGRYSAIYDALLAVRNRLTWLQPLLRRLNRLLRVRPPVQFRGWGMTTEHALPWEGGPMADTFTRARSEVQDLAYTGEAGIDQDSLAVLDWRHWIVTWAAHQAMTFTKSGAFVECGVADGTTAYFALSSLQAHDSSDRQFHLYDAWDAMRAEALSSSEQVQAGRYGGLQMELTRRNLAPFDDRLVWHPGHIPDTLFEDPEAPESVAYVHIDLNASAPTIAACEFFWDRMPSGGIFLFDDYGWKGFEDTRDAVDTFFADRPGVMLQLPTAQAAFQKA